MDTFQIDFNEPSVTRRVAWGVRWGAALASVFALVALIQYGLQGDALQRSSRLSLGDIVSIYVVGGVVGGAIVGIILPLARRRSIAPTRNFHNGLTRITSRKVRDGLLDLAKVAGAARHDCLTFACWLTIPAADKREK